MGYEIPRETRHALITEDYYRTGVLSANIAGAAPARAAFAQLSDITELIPG
jgi:hypothetical protein